MLLDAQFVTEHRSQFGSEEISRSEYQRRLKRAMAAEGAFQRLTAAAGGAAAVTGAEALQLITQAS